MEVDNTRHPHFSTVGAMQSLLFLVAVLSLLGLGHAQCDTPGICLGIQLDLTVADTVELCQEHCRGVQGCQWFTHD